MVVLVVKRGRSNCESMIGVLEEIADELRHKNPGSSGKRDATEIALTLYLAVDSIAQSTKSLLSTIKYAT